jgi:flagellar operon protein
MVDELHGRPIYPVRQPVVKPAVQPQNPSGPSFSDVLKTETQKGVTISRHAENRIADRRIRMDAARMRSLNDAIERASSKGARESLVLFQDAAFVVSVKNRTVITAVDKDSWKENVFTNIDSAVVVDESQAGPR